MSKFEEIARTIENRVQSGMYNAGQRIPSEYQLATELQVSRLTVRKAIRLLIEKQILVKDPGKGTYAMYAPKSFSKIESGRGGLQSFTEVAESNGHQAHSKVLKFVPIKNPDKTISDQLDLINRIDQSVYLLERIRYWDDVPLTLEKVIICGEYIKDKSKSDFNGSLFKILKHKVEIAYSHQTIDAVLVDKTISKLLDVKVGQPLFKVHSIAYTTDARPIFCDTSYYRADKYSFKSTLTRFH